MKPKRKIILFIGTFMLIGIIIMLSYRVGIVNALSAAYKSIQGRFYVNDGVMVSDRTDMENFEVANSIDPLTDEPAVNYDSSAYVYDDELLGTEETTKNFTIETNWNGIKQLELKYTYINGSYTFLNTYGDENYFVYTSPNKDIYLLYYCDSLYLLDIEKASGSIIISDKENFPQEDTEKLLAANDDSYFYFEWAANPYFNLTGTMFSYHTTRESLHGGSTNGEVRIKNLITKEDYSFGEIGYECIGWDTNDNVYYLNYDGYLVRLDTKNFEATVLKDIGYQEELSLCSPYIITAQRSSELTIYNLETLESEVYTNERFEMISQLSASPDEKHALFVNSINSNIEDSDSAHWDLGVFAIDEKSFYYFEVPAETYIKTLSWLDNDTFITTISYWSNREEVTLIVELDSLEKIN